MRIDQAGLPFAASSGRGAGRSGRARGGFALPDDEPGQTAAAGPEAPALVGLSCLMPTEAAGAPGSEAGRVQADQVAARQGRALLDALSGLHLAALGGGGGNGCGAQARATLTDLARALPQAADPRLDEVIRAIAQRAAIELARAG